MLEAFTTVFDKVGPWAALLLVVVWLAFFLNDQLEKGRQERLSDSQQHADEINKLSEVVQANTIAIQKLVTMLEQDKKEG